MIGASGFLEIGPSGLLDDAMTAFLLRDQCPDLDYNGSGNQVVLPNAASGSSPGVVDGLGLSWNVHGTVNNAPRPQIGIHPASVHAVDTIVDGVPQNLVACASRTSGTCLLSEELWAHLADPLEQMCNARDLRTSTSAPIPRDGTRYDVSSCSGTY